MQRLHGELPYTLHSASSNVNILLKCGTFVTAETLAMTRNWSQNYKLYLDSASFSTNVLFLSRHPIPKLVAVFAQPPPGCDSFSIFPCFLMAWWLWRGTNFVSTQFQTQRSGKNNTKNSVYFSAFYLDSRVINVLLHLLYCFLSLGCACACVSVYVYICVVMVNICS